MKTVFLCMCVVALCGCGVKPKELAPPTDAGKVFPRTYPNPDTLGQ